MQDRRDATLIFPCCVPEGVAYAGSARQRGEQVVAASSLPYDTTACEFETWFRLPSVYDSDFARRLQDAVTKYNIARIYCPVSVARIALMRLVHEGRLSIPIVGEMPTDRHAHEHQSLMASATSIHCFSQIVSEGRSPLTAVEVASVLRQSLGIFGESDQSKIGAMMGIFADAPPGDVIEIGVLAGRTACVLAMMAERHGTGAVLVIDPWNIVDASQRESTGDVQAAIDTWDTAVQFESFIVALLPIAGRRRFNYLALSSRQAYPIWLDRRVVETPYFGTVRYSDSISVLHVDGNHDFVRVSEDCALWLPHLAPGGWLILDDYVSFHCDGPRRVGDALLRERARCVQRAFVCGKALFMKLAGPSHA
jgi:hypothetical protein